MIFDVFSYEYFIERSMNLDRNHFMLPEYSQKQFNQVKKKLNIKKDLVKESSIKATVFTKQEEIIATLFKYFNKITDKTYDKISSEIILLVSDSLSEKKKICTTFFQVVLNNSIFCHLYAKLYKQFIQIDNNYDNVLSEQIITYANEIKNIVYVSPNVDYDKYCDYTKKVEGVKNFTKFLIQCLEYHIIADDLLLDIATTFQKYCLDNIEQEDKLFLNEIYISNVVIIIKYSYSIIHKNGKWKTFMENHSKLINTEGGGKNKKIYFKLLDITELINNKS